MFAWLMTLPVGLDVLVFGLIVGVIVLIVFLINGIVRKSGSVYLGKSGLVIKGGENQKALISLIAKGISLQEEIDRLRFVELIREQMTYADMKIREIQSLFLEKYSSELLAKGKVTNIEDSIQYVSFSRLMALLREEDSMPKLRVAIRENHFDTMDELEFHDYVKEKSEWMCKIAADFIRDKYRCFDEKCLTKDELIEALRSIKPRVLDILEDLFVELRHRAIEVGSEIYNLKEEQNRLFKFEK